MGIIKEGLDSGSENDKRVGDNDLRDAPSVTTNVHGTIKEVLDCWKEDKRIGDNDLVVASLSTPDLYEKYLRLYYGAKASLRKLQLAYKNLVLAKREFYTIGPVKETNTLGWEYRPKNRKLIKGEVKDWVDADPDVQKLYLKLSQQEDLVDCIKAVIDGVKDRQWAIKNAMDHMKWLSGAGG